MGFNLLRKSEVERSETNEFDIVKEWCGEQRNVDQMGDCSQNRCRKIWRSVCNLRRGVREGRPSNKRKRPNREWKNRAEVKLLSRSGFERFICERKRTLYLFLIYLDPVGEFRIKEMWWNTGVLLTARAAEFMTSWDDQFETWVADWLSRRELQVNFRLNDNSAGSSLINSLRTRLRSRV